MKSLRIYMGGKDGFGELLPLCPCGGGGGGDDDDDDDDDDAC